MRRSINPPWLSFHKHCCQSVVVAKLSLFELTFMATMLVPQNKKGEISMASFTSSALLLPATCSTAAPAYRQRRVRPRKYGSLHFRP